MPDETPAQSRHDREHEVLSSAVDKHAARMHKAERERQTVLGYTVFTGTIAGLIVIPIVGGAYLGHWLDSMADDYSVRWTVGLILLGVVIGAVNVYRYLEQHQ